MKKLYVFTLLVSSLAWSSCWIDFDDGPFGCIRGVGNIVSVELNVDNFDGIRLSIPAEVVVEQGDEFSVVAEGYENIIDLIDRDVRNGVWRIRTNRCIRDADELTIFITVPELEEVTVSGSGRVRSTNTFAGNEMNIDISGSGDVDMGLEMQDINASISGSGTLFMEGATEYGDYKITGSGEVRAFGLASQRTDVNVTGSGSAEVWVSNQLDVRITGSGDVYFKGDPNITQSITGSGRVIDAN